MTTLHSPKPNPRTALTAATTGSGAPALDSWGSGPPPAGAQATATRPSGNTVYSRGYKEEMEHLAYCIRMREQAMSADRPNVRCDGVHAMADAIIALTANLAMKNHQRIEFKPEWFDPKSPEVPDAEMKPETITA